MFNRHTYAMGPVVVKATPKQYEAYLKIEQALDRYNAFHPPSGNNISIVLQRHTMREILGWRKFFSAYSKMLPKVGYVKLTQAAAASGGLFVPVTMP